MNTSFPCKLTLITAALCCASGSLVAQTLTNEGPSPFIGGQSEDLNDEQVGAINALAPHPTDPDILYIGAVNGGVWRTTDATATSPSWTALTDSEASLSILDLAIDPTDVTAQTLAAAIGRTSSLGRMGGARRGLLYTSDGGTTWTTLSNGLTGSNLSGVAPRGAIIVASADDVDGGFSCAGTGIFRSADSGATFTQVTNGISGGSVDSLVSDPIDPTVLYASIVRASSDCGGATGIYKSSDTGTSWTKVSNAAMDAQLADTTDTHVEMAVGSNDNVFVAIALGQLAGVHRSGDGGTTFVEMDLPGTQELITPGMMDTEFVGIHAGGQASIHMSIAADPTDDNLVYIGGDRQPGQFQDGANGGPLFPNSIGATTFSGRAFRGDASLAPGSQWQPLTHVGTASNSAIHADSRDMAFSANGNLLEADDGGVYSRTSPQNASGDWSSINGNLQTTEVHSAFYDTNSNIMTGGAQDNSQGNQIATGSTTWEVLLGGDGGDFIIDTQTLAADNQSVRFTSTQNLGNFVRVVYDDANVFQTFNFPARTVVSGQAGPIPQFVTPTAMNTEDGNRIVFGFSNRDLDGNTGTPDGGVYESSDQGETLTQILPAGVAAFGFGFNSIVAGGPGNAELLYVAANTDLFRRTAAGQAMTSVFASANSIVAVQQDQQDIDQAFLVEISGGVFQTTDGGDNWADISGDLLSFDPGRLFAVVHLSNPFSAALGNFDAVAVGADRGVFIASDETGFTTWTQITEVPNAPTFGLEFNIDLNELYVNTLGRGTFSFGPVFTEQPDPTIFEDGFETP